VILADDSKPFDSPQDDVEPPIVQALRVRDDAAAPDGIHRRTPLVVALPARPQQHHADHPIRVERVGHHVAIARLEDVERLKDVREKHDIGEGKNRQKLRHRRLSIW